MPKAIKQKVMLKVRCVGREYSAEGKTLDEVFSKISIPNGSHAMSVITVTSKDGVKERILNGRQTHGLFGIVSPTSRAIILNGVKRLFQ